MGPPTQMSLYGFDGEPITYRECEDGYWRGPCPRCVNNAKDSGVDHDFAVMNAVEVRFRARVQELADPVESSVPKTREMAAVLGSWMLVAPVQLLHVGCCEAAVKSNTFCEARRR